MRKGHSLKSAAQDKTSFIDYPNLKTTFQSKQKEPSRQKSSGRLQPSAEPIMISTTNVVETCHAEHCRPFICALWISAGQSQNKQSMAGFQVGLFPNTYFRSPCLQGWVDSGLEIVVDPGILDPRFNLRWGKLAHFIVLFNTLG